MEVLQRLANSNIVGSCMQKMRASWPNKNITKHLVFAEHVFFGNVYVTMVNCSKHGAQKSSYLEFSQHPYEPRGPLCGLNAMTHHPEFWEKTRAQN